MLTINTIQFPLLKPILYIPTVENLRNICARIDTADRKLLDAKKIHAKSTSKNVPVIRTMLHLKSFDSKIVNFEWGGGKNQILFDIAYDLINRVQ